MNQTINTHNHSHNDKLSRFLFDNHEVRGEVVNLSETYQKILDNHNYPLAVQKLLGELLVATSLLTATLKFEGDITVQLQGDGPLSLAVINGNNHQHMRGVARVNRDIADNASLKEMMGNGYIVITITPKSGERYQGIVALESYQSARNLVKTADITYAASLSSYKQGVATLTLVNESAKNLTYAKKIESQTYFASLMAASNLAFVLGFTINSDNILSTAN